MGGRDVRGGHDLFCESLAAFDLGAFFTRTEDLEANRTEFIGDSQAKGRLRTDHDEIRPG